MLKITEEFWLCLDCGVWNDCWLIVRVSRVWCGWHLRNHKLWMWRDLTKIARSVIGVLMTLVKWLTREWVHIHCVSIKVTPLQIS